MFRIDFYCLPGEKAPVEEFLDSLSVKMRSKALDSIEILKEFGNRLREPYSKAIGDGIFELRIKFSGGITRILYFFAVENRIILTNGFIKKTDKTPAAEIDLARRCKREYERRMRHG